MYAAVPRITPMCVAATLNVGDCETSGFATSPSKALARPKSSTFTVPSGRTLMLAGFRSRWMTPCSCARLERLGDLPRDRQRLVQRNRALRDPIGQRRAHRRAPVRRAPSCRLQRLFEAVDRRDVGMIQRRQELRLALEAREAVRIGGEELGQDFQRDVAIEPRVARAIHLAHAARADGDDDLVSAEPCSGTHCHTIVRWNARIVA